MKNQRNKSITVYLILIFTLPLISLVLINAFQIFQQGIPYFILYGFEAITPTISALLVINIFYGKREVFMFLKKSYIENLKIKNITLAFLLVLMIGLVTFVLCEYVSDISILNTDISISKVIVLLWALVAEELGWRGFLQEELDKKLNKKIVPLIIGIIWSLWHYHFFLLGTISVPIVLFTISCIIDSYIYYLLTKKSKQNIIPASIYHFMGNTLFSILLIYPNSHNGNVLPYIFYIIASFMVMICFLGCESVSKKNI